MRSSTADLAFLSLLVAGVAYFSVDGWFGASGGARLAEMEQEAGIEAARLAELVSERDALQAKTAGLAGPQIDPDLLDQELRAAFGVGRADEALILAPAPPPAAP